jgi:FkbM family methyltransferase
MNLLEKMGNKWRGLADNLFFDNRMLLLIHRVFFRGMSLVVYKKRQLTFVVDFAGGDECGTRFCLTSDMYARYFKHLNPQRPVKVLDLGANGGGFVLSLCAGGFIIEQAVCVEMNPQTYTRLSFNLAYNRIAAVSVNAAIAGKSGTVDILDSRGSTSESMYQQHNTRTGTVTVSLTTLDSLVESHFGNGSDVLDLLKMDVEGAEYEVLLSNSCSSLGRFKYFLVEIHNHPSISIRDLLKRIGDLGFSGIENSPRCDHGVYFFENVKLL